MYMESSCVRNEHSVRIAASAETLFGLLGLSVDLGFAAAPPEPKESKEAKGCVGMVLPLQSSVAETETRADWLIAV